MTVSEQIIQVIDVLCAKFGIVIDWTSENVIPYIETLCGKLVSYEIGTSIAWMAIWLALSIGGIVITKKIYLKFKEEKEEDKRSYDCVWDMPLIFAAIGLTFISFITIFVICTQTMDIIKCMTFPEMYVFEYVQRIIKVG